MARGGIYKSEVKRAREQVRAQGRHPSVDAVRIELGNTGSKTTIQRYLREIEEEEGGRTGGKVVLSDVLQNLTLRLAEQLQEEADQKLVQLQAAHAEELRAAREAGAALQDELQSVAKALEGARRDVAEGQQRYDELTARFAAEAQMRAQVQQLAADVQTQLQVQTAHSESLEAKYADARRSLEHFREAAKEQRDRETRKHESEVQFLQQEIRSLQNALTEAQAKFVTANDDRTRLQTDLAAATRGLEAVDRAKGELAAVTERLARAMADREGLSKQLEAERRRADVLAGDAQKGADERQRLETRVRELEAALLTANVRQESSERLQAQIDEQIRAQFGRLLQGAKKPARA